jgi:chromatin segregation and condensation protein Rec8/ScpA/Scc1 (kleisin family)
MAVDRPRGDALEREPLEEVELWDLVSAFSRIVRENQGGAAVEYSVRRHADSRPHGTDRGALKRTRPCGARRVVRAGDAEVEARRHVLAVLELARHHSVKTEQQNLFGEIHVYPRADGKVSVDAEAADAYDHQATHDGAAAAAESATATAVIEQPEAARAKRARGKKAK